MKRLSVIILLTSITFLGYGQDQAQVKPDCQPKSCNLKDKKACSPGDTKLGEAKVITELRSDLQLLKNSDGNVNAIEVGETDEQSLEILIMEFERIGKAPASGWGDTNARRVAKLRKMIDKQLKK